ncbi:hypothetical protein ACQ4PT_062457 [Festuca glaucescens]
MSSTGQLENSRVRSPSIVPETCSLVSCRQTRVMLGSSRDDLKAHRSTLGDLGGDLATPPPVREHDVRDGGGSPEWLRGSRFWLLQSIDDEGEGGEEELSSVVEDCDMPIRYLCRTPSPASGRDIDEDSRELARRTLKRIKRQDAQREATKAAMALEFSEGESSSAGGMNNANQYQHWAGNHHRNSGYNSGNNLGYGGNQQRWHADRGFQYRARDNGASMQPRSGIDSELLHQTVQAVVAAVTAATKVSEQSAPSAVANAASLTGGTDQHAMTSVAAPNAVPQPTQGVQANQGAGAKGKDNEGQGPQKKKKEEKSGCFRCKQPGHHIDDCPTPFCDLCESVHHATPACHLHQAPKPNAILHGYANEALMFFELSCGAFKAKVENPKLAKVTVEGDAMTIPELIDQLKKIVPSDKFHWEVFHFKENIYRVKLPSKQEVQRLKNLGSYICNDREAILFFDIWSSLEEPMYTLPEVWVRVSGLPTDIRSDYLSLWGVGTLFGKTLDVDMAYTRNNKVLRTKIGCLDRTLIPKDTDMFIRRGFFKLHFEVEEANGSQEVNMVEENNGNDGSDDAHDGEHNKERGNAMDMDPKGPDEGNNSNNGGQDGAMINNGIQGMQLAQPLEAIKIGSIKVPLSPTGTPLSVQNLGHKMQFSNTLSHVKIQMLNDKTGVDSHADCAPGVSTLGLPQVGINASGLLPQSCRQTALPQSDEQQEQLASSSELPTDSSVGSSGQQRARDGSQLVGEPADATREGTVHPAAKAGSGAAAGAEVSVHAMGFSTQKIRLQDKDASGLTPLSATHAQQQHGAGEMCRPGLSAPNQTMLNAHAASWPQKIQPPMGGGAATGQAARANHWLKDGQSLGPDAATIGGSYVHAMGVAHGIEQASNFPFNCFNSEVISELDDFARLLNWDERRGPDVCECSDFKISR